MTAQPLPPSGTVTFLFTDVEGSTELWEREPEAMRSALELHDGLLRGVIERYRGYVFATAGDSFAASFSRVGDALDAAAGAQQALATASWPVGAMIRVRMGVHSGEAQERDGDYFGPAVNRAARIMAAGHGGQVVLSSVSASLADGRSLGDLGEHQLKDLTEPDRLWQLAVDGEAESFPALRTLSAHRHNLPVQRTELLGRDEELRRVDKLLRGHRLVTLTGVGGTGKTRLGLAVAAQALDRFADGVFFVDLTPIGDGDLMAQAVADAVGLTLPVGMARDPMELVAAELGDRTLLLVLDNCEHVIDAAADMVDELLEVGQGVRVLATSREALDVEGEQAMRVPSLAWTLENAGHGPAVELLIERATEAGSELDLRADLESLVELCERVDGIPLAIELVAVQLRHVPPSDLITQLEDRFRVLVGGRRRRRQRQQTLSAMMDWSWDLLDDTQRRVLAGLSVFAGGFTPEAASAVSGLDHVATSQTLGELVAKSLVVPARDLWGARYRLLETVRLYGLQKLMDQGRVEQVRDAHARWLADWCDQAPFEDQWMSADHAAVMRREFDNVRAAIDWLIGAGDLSTQSRIIRSCCYLFREDFYRDEALQWTTRIDWSTLPSADLARVTLTEAEALFVHLDYDGMRDAGYRAYELAAVAGEDAIAAAGLVISSQGLINVDYGEGKRRLDEAVERAQRADAPRVETIARNLLMFSAPGDVSLEERAAAVAILHELAGPSGLDHEAAVMADAELALHAGNPRRSHELCVSVIEESLERGLTTSASRIAITAACYAAEIPDEDLWHHDLQLAADEFHRAGVHRAAADLVMVLAYWEAHNGDPYLAAELLGVARKQQLFDMGSYKLWSQARDTIRETGDPAELDRARQRGNQLDVADTLATRLGQRGLTPRPFRSLGA